MNWFLGAIVALFAIGTIGEKNNEKRGMYALCFLVSIVALTLINIF